ADDGAAGASGAEDGGSGSADGGGSGSGGEAGSVNAGTCALDGDPRTEPCLVGDDHAIFVAPDGDDAATGSRSTPVASVATAVERALDEDKLVIVCAKSYSEPLTLSDSRRARIYGGCARDDARQPLAAPSAVA